MPTLKLTTRKCRGCGITETGPSRYMRNQFCSKECWRVHMAGKYLRRGQDYACAYCQKLIYKRPGNVRYANVYCSMSCRLKAKQRYAVKTTCPTCEKVFTQPEKDSIYCSYRCSKLGPLNPNWNPARTNRRLGLAREWRRAVFNRDNYTCQICGERGGQLHPHHKDAFQWAIDRRNDVTNGVTLCINCHIKFHSLYGRNCTESQFLKFKAIKEIPHHGGSTTENVISNEYSTGRGVG